jgi:hypothetical protein
VLSKILRTTLVLAALSAPRSLAAQTMVTFEVPVNLTQLAPEITKIRVYCVIKSTAIVAPNAGNQSGTDELPVLGGQLVTTMRVVISFPAGTLQAPTGKTAQYQCDLQGVTASGAGGFSETTSVTAFQLKPTPPSLTGNFVW